MAHEVSIGWRAYVALMAFFVVSGLVVGGIVAYQAGYDSGAASGGITNGETFGASLMSSFYYGCANGQMTSYQLNGITYSCPPAFTTAPSGAPTTATTTTAPPTYSTITVDWHGNGTLDMAKMLQVLQQTCLQVNATDGGNTNCDFSAYTVYFGSSDSLIQNVYISPTEIAVNATVCSSPTFSCPGQTQSSVNPVLVSISAKFTGNVEVVTAFGSLSTTSLTVTWAPSDSAVHVYAG